MSERILATVWQCPDNGFVYAGSPENDSARQVGVLVQSGTSFKVRRLTDAPKVKDSHVKLAVKDYLSRKLSEAREAREYAEQPYPEVEPELAQAPAHMRDTHIGKSVPAERVLSLKGSYVLCTPDIDVPDDQRPYWLHRPNGKTVRIPFERATELVEEHDVPAIVGEWRRVTETDPNSRVTPYYVLDFVLRGDKGERILKRMNTFDYAPRRQWDGPRHVMLRNPEAFKGTLGPLWPTPESDNRWYIKQSYGADWLPSTDQIKASYEHTRKNQPYTTE